MTKAALVLPLRKLNKMIVQAGLTVGLKKVASIMHAYLFDRHLHFACS